MIDLDDEQGRISRGDNKFYFVMRQTGTIYLEALRAYLQGVAEWDNHILECMNFFDHALRQKPSEELISIKRNFYAKNAPQTLLDNSVCAAKGIYASIRL